MRNKLIIPALILVALSATVDASARTWRVELDGSGDHVDIQPAVEASAAGDTILIGPGRFDTFHPVVAPAWTEQTVIWVTRDNLTFIGAGQGVTIIGPTTYYGPLGRSPKGVCSIDGFSGVVRNLSIENIDTGIYWWRGSLGLEDCTITGGNNQSFGGLALWPYGATVRNCTIDTRFAGSSCIVGAVSRDILFENCTFKGFGYGPTITDSTQNVRFVGCEFLNLINGLHCDHQSTVEVTDCSFQSISVTAINVLNDSRATLDRVTIDGARTGIAAAGGGIVTGTNIVIQGAWSEAVLPCCNSFVTIHNSHILAGPGYAVQCLGTWAHSQFPDLTGNYWGTTDAEAIRASIWDANDTSDTNGIVDFEPYAGGPVSTESTSWGDLKALWR
jgi:hypothetical protein